MPKIKRIKSEPTENWPELQLKFDWPEQEMYELIRPVVLFGRTPKQRSKESGVKVRTIQRKVKQFEEQGMAALLLDEPEITPKSARDLPEEIRRYIVELKAQHPPFRPNEISNICYVQFERQVSPHTVKKVLEQTPLPEAATAVRRYPFFSQIEDPAEQRLAVVHLHSEGWNIKTIGDYLQVTRRTIYLILQRWIDEGVKGLPDKSHARKDGVRKVDLKAINTVRELQENENLGEFRIHTALKQLGIHLSPRTCGRILERNRQLYFQDIPHSKKKDKKKKEMPFKGERRHQYWSVDVRYIEEHLLGGGYIYVITILENYSRAVLASAISRSQDLKAYLMVLHAAVRTHGSPEMLVSDSGAIFLAKQAKEIYEALGIEKKQIAKRQPWQDLIETQFNVQRRMADYHFGKAKNWEEMLAEHDKWVTDFNFQDHWAHRERTDNRHSPAAVLGWVRGELHENLDLDKVFHSLRFKCTINKIGYVRFRYWEIYGELGLAKKSAAVWLYKEMLTIEFNKQALSEYSVEYGADAKELKEVKPVQLFETGYKSPQLHLWSRDQVEWRLVLRRSTAASQAKKANSGWTQPLLFAEGS
jgi:transposase